MTNMRLERPSYLVGSFDWFGLGYQFTHNPPQEVIENEFLLQDPWNCLGRVLALWRRRSQPDSSILQRIILQDLDEPTLLSACWDLLADTAGAREMAFLERMMLEGKKHQKLAACWAAQWVGDLELVQTMLAARGSLNRSADRDTVMASISNMLEADAPGTHPQLYDFEGNEEEYAQTVLETCREIAYTWPGHRYFYGGCPIDIVKMTSHFRDMVYNLVHYDMLPAQSLVIQRRRFEVATGVDCRQMFSNRRFNPQAALDLLDECQRSIKDSKYVVGVRYFLGYALPAAEG